MKVGDLVKYKADPVNSTNPPVLVVKVWPGVEVSVSVVDSSGQQTGRFADQLEIINESR